MRITKISVTGLFGMFDHEIPLNQESRITIVHGPNGVGKTVLMRMVNSLFHYEYWRIGSIPFENLDIQFAWGSSLNVQRIETDKKLVIRYSDDSGIKEILYEPEVIDSLELDAKLVAARLTGGRPDILSDDLLSQVDDLRQRYPPDNVQLCRGKVVIAIMAHILPALYESRFGEALPDSAREIFQEKRLAKELRKAYEYIYFKSTSLFGCIQNWESSNSPYKVLKA